MPDQNEEYRIFLSAAEPSADAHCAGLVRALRAHRIEFVGVGGPKMAQAGCMLLESTVGRAAMLYNAFAHVAYFYKLIRRISQFLRTTRVDLVVVCDSPSFNFHVAKAARKAGIKTLFYVAPQLWAWGGWRIGKLRRTCDRLCCLLPFEQDWFARRGVEAVFVGNPLFDEMKIDRQHYRRYEDFMPENARFAIMPGSRPAEINSLWRPMQQIALRLKSRYTGATFVTVAVDAERQRILTAAQLPDFECQYVLDSVHNTARAADFSIVASGSATLEVAAAGCPMVIMYQSSRVLWHLVGRWLVTTEYLSLVNILSGRELVPEFMPYFSSIDPIAAAIEQLIEDRDGLTRLSTSLAKLIEPLAEKNASEEVAKVALEMLH